MRQRTAVPQRAAAKALACAATLAATGLQPAVAAVNSLVTYDEFVFVDVSDPFGDGAIRGPAHGLGHGLPSASLSVSNPSGIDQNSGLPYQFEGDFSSSAQTTEGINKAFARAEGSKSVVDGQRLTGVYGLSGWHERIVVSGGTGTGTLTLTAQLDGAISVWGPANAQGLSGRAGAWLNYVVSDQAIGGGFDLFDSGLAFACTGDDAQECDHDTALFRDVGSLSVVADQSLAFDETATLTIAFEYDRPFYLYGTLEVAAYAFNADAGAEADFLHTGKITSFVAPAGSTVTLASGAYKDFALAVPEPATGLLALGGLAVAAILRRRPKLPPARH